MKKTKLTPQKIEHWLFVVLLAVHVLAYAIKTLSPLF